MMDKVATWQVKNSRQVADCKVFKVREDASVCDEDGPERSWATRPGGGDVLKA